MRYRRSIAALVGASVFLVFCTVLRRVELFESRQLVFTKRPWEFNRPLEMKVRGRKDKQAIASQNAEKERSDRRLSDMQKILHYNSDPLPTRSAFGTTGNTTVCEGIDHIACVPKFKHFETRIRHAKKYKTVACLMQKSMSTILQAIMCFLHDEAAFRKAGRVLSRESYAFRFCTGKNEINHYKGNTLHRGPLDIDESWLHLAVVRDPLDRFLSGFVDKCLRKPRGKYFCNGCRSNMTCFLEREYKRIQSQLRTGKLTHDFDDRHFYPQNWRCDFRWHFKHYRLLHYRSQPNATDDFLAQLLPLLQKQGVPEESLQFIRDQLKSGRTVHSTIDSAARQFFERRLRSSPYLMEHVIRLFYEDFRLFNYEIPDVRFDEEEEEDKPQ
ncbi:hypothetical protein M3Y99_00215000 [Aphelenchoides fujianensis]|nr:hypothetical protein M3Y99_00215000 [Aphelenchoides fujianensis]